MLLQVFTSVIVLGLAIAAFVIIEVKGFKDRKVVSANILAELVGFNSISALEFLDHGAGKKMLSELVAQPDILNANLLDKNGAVFASYTRQGFDTAFRFSIPAKYEKLFLFTDQYLFIHHCIQKDNETIGFVNIRFELSQLNKIKMDVFRLAIVLLLFGVGFAFLIAVIIQPYISNPLLNLVNLMQKVRGSADYKTRAVVEGEDEIAALSLSFNTMLSTIEKRDTELAQSKQELDQQNTLLNSVIQNMGDGLVVADKIGKIILSNVVAQKLNKLGATETPPENWAEAYGYFLPGTQIPFKTDELPLVRALKGEDVDNIEVCIRNPKLPEGIFVTVTARPLKDPAGGTTGAVVVFHDITERKNAENEIKKLNTELERSLSIMRATLESTADGILVVDRAGKISGFNQNFVNLWKLPDAILATKDDNQTLAFVRDQLKYSEVFLNRVKELYAAPERESFDVLELKDGRIFERYSKPQFAKEGTIGRVWSFRDTTQRKRAEDEIKKLNADLEQKVIERTARLAVANENLSKSEEKYRKIVEEVGDVVYTADYKGYFTYINPACETLTGYKQKEIVGKHFSELIAPEWKARVVEFYSNQFKNRIAETLFSFPIITKTGEQKWVEQTVLQVREGDRVVEQKCIVRDITERKAAEQKLIESEEKLNQSNVFVNSIIENIPNVLVVKDAKELRYLRVNKAGEKILNRPEKEMVGKTQYDFFPKEQADALISEDMAVLKDGIQKDYEEGPIDTKSGKKWFHTYKIPVKNLKGEPIYLIGISEDITEKKIAKDLLEKSNKRLIEIFNFSPIAIGITGLADGIFIYANDVYCETVGFKREEIIGKTNDELNLVSSEDRKKIEHVFQESGGHIKSVEIKIRKANGGLLDVLFSAVLVEIENKMCVIGTAIDITERMKAEEIIKQKSEELKKTIEQLELSVKEMESFSYSVSHDLRSPVRAINSFTNLLKKDYNDKFDETGKDLLNIITSEALRMGQLIDDLLAFSRLGKKEIQKSIVDMNALAKDVVDEILKLAEVKYKAKITVMDLPPANGDIALIRQVFVNLISNALKFSNLKPEPVIEIGFKSEINETVYYIKDNGAGFDMKYYDKLFGVFQRLHSAEDFKGTGIGLAIAKRIITSHGGRIWGEGKVNEGATFYFSLPKLSSLAQ